MPRGLGRKSKWPASSSTTSSESSLPPLVPELVGASAAHDYEDPMATWEEQQFAKMRRKHSTGAIIIDQSNAMSRYIQPVFRCVLEFSLRRASAAVRVRARVCARAP